MISSWIPPEIPQPSAKTLEAVDKLASYMKAKAAKNPPEPKEPKDPRTRSYDGRFVGLRVNEDEVPRLPIFPAQWALDDPRQRPYLVVWGNGQAVEPGKGRVGRRGRQGRRGLHGRRLLGSGWYDGWVGWWIRWWEAR